MIVISVRRSVKRCWSRAKDVLIFSQDKVSSIKKVSGLAHIPVAFQTRSIMGSDVKYVVLGNESCDLDSAVSAFVFAAFLSKVTKEPHTAVLNIARADYRLHTEVTHVFNECGVSANSLTCRDEIDLACLCGAGLLRLTIVDHNVLAAGDRGLEPCVVRVLDHHKLELEPRDSVQCRVEPVGSCCSLVADEVLKSSVQLPDYMWRMLLGGILLDTADLCPDADRARDLDRAMVLAIQRLQRRSLYKSLMQAKSDVSKLNVNELLRKDAKTVNEAGKVVMMSSLPLSLLFLLSKPEAECDIERLIKQRSLSVLVLMTLTVDEHDRVQRQLAVLCPDSQLLDKLVAGLMSVSPSLELSPLSIASAPALPGRWFVQANIKASRKQVLPALQLILRSML